MLIIFLVIIIKESNKIVILWWTILTGTLNSTHTKCLNFTTETSILIISNSNNSFTKHLIRVIISIEDIEGKVINRAWEK